VDRPEYELIDARDHGVDARGLRALARDRGAATEAAYSSRSYRDPLALIAWFDRPVGADIERIEPHDRAFAESICTPQERRDLADRLEDPETVTALWSSKEALAKALGDALDYDPRRVDSPMTWAGGEAGAWRAQRLEVAPKGHIIWLCWRIT
jgi:hypothetical protein